MKRFLALMLTLCLCAALPTMAFATDNTSTTDVEVVSSSVSNEPGIEPQAGNELWNGKGTVHVGSFTMYGNNLTPIKTTGWAGPLAIITKFSNPTSNAPVIVRVEIRDAKTQKVLGYKVSTAKQSGQITTYADVQWHQEIQIFFKVYDKNGTFYPSQACWIDYSYDFYATS